MERPSASDVAAAFHFAMESAGEHVRPEDTTFRAPRPDVAATMLRVGRTDDEVR
jgi:hypothetical protein